MRVVTRSAVGTKRLAAKIAKESAAILSKMPRALVVSLEGNLGAGKTTFIQGFAKGLGIRQRILSPTFVLMKRFPISLPHTLNPKPFLYHIDCYRLVKARELVELGWREIVRAPGNLVLVEWGDKVRRIMPRHHLCITFSVAGKDKRRIDMRAQG